MNKDQDKTKEQLISELGKMRQRVAELGVVDTERKQIEHNLHERIKELQCLYAISKFAEITDISLDELYQEVANLLPSSWQYPEITGARITINGKKFETENYIDTEWKQSSDVKVYGAKAGTLEVGYLEKRPELDEGPFLKEERRLIDATAEQLGRIAERKQAEKKLQENEERYRALVSLQGKVGEAIVMLQDTEQGDAIQTFVSDQWPSLTGYSKEELLGMSFFNLIRPKYRKASLERHRRKMSGESIPELFEMSIIRKDGTEVPIELTSAYTTHQGRTANVAFIRDITEHKKMENQLRESEERYRDLFEDAPNAYFSVGKDGHIKMANKRAAELLGYTMDELVGRPILDLYADTPTGKAQAEKVFKRFRAGEEIRGEELEMRSVDGKQVWINLSVRSIKDAEGQIIASRSIVVDVTQRKYMQQAFAEEKRRLEATLRSTGDGVITTDIDGKVVLVSKVAENLTGWAQKEAAGKLLNEVFYVIDERTRKRLGNPVETVLKTGRIIGLTNHAVLIARDGTERIIADSGAPIHDEHGQLLGVVLVFRDITELRRLQEELVKAAKLESVAALAGGIAHDFNNLLTGIMGNISLAKRYLESGKAFDRLLEAEKASVRAKDLTQQLLTFSTGGAPIKKTISITDLIKDSVDFALRGSNISCEFSLPDNLSLVEADEGQMNQVIVNLVINAKEAMPEGGILKIGAKNTAIERRGALPLPLGKYVQVSIEDTGVGISRKHLERIFEPYFTTKQQGSGLGLPTAYSIIKNHGGYITTRSTPTVGTTFCIYLPASDKLMLAQEKAAVETRLVGKGRILVMDDEEIIRKLLDAALTDAGYEVELTVDGAEAIKQYTKAKGSGQPFDAVILDLTVPGGVGGKEVIKKLLEIDPSVKAIVSSGYSTDPIMSQFRDYGFCGVVAKPYNMAQMEEILQGILGKNG